MGMSKPTPPLHITVRTDLSKEQQEQLDIRLPFLSPRIHRAKGNIQSLDVGSIQPGNRKIKDFSKQKKREIVFTDILTDEEDHTTELETILEPIFASVVGYIARKIVLDVRVLGHFDCICSKMREYIETRLFEEPVCADDENILRNLCESVVRKFLIDEFKKALNALTVKNADTVHVTGEIRVSQAMPQVVSYQDHLFPTKSLLTPLIGDSDLELEFAKSLDCYKDIVSFAKNRPLGVNFYMEYQTQNGSIARYYPDFIVKKSDEEIWIIETKGLETTEAPGKFKRLLQWCQDATEYDQNGKNQYNALYVVEDEWEEYRPSSFAELCELFRPGE